MDEGFHRSGRVDLLALMSRAIRDDRDGSMNQDHDEALARGTLHVQERPLPVTVLPDDVLALVGTREMEGNVAVGTLHEE